MTPLSSNQISNITGAHTYVAGPAVGCAQEEHGVETRLVKMRPEWLLDPIKRSRVRCRMWDTTGAMSALLPARSARHHGAVLHAGDRKGAHLAKLDGEVLYAGALQGGPPGMQLRVPKGCPHTQRQRRIQCDLLHRTWELKLRQVLCSCHA